MNEDKAKDQFAKALDYTLEDVRPDSDVVGSWAPIERGLTVDSQEHMMRLQARAYANVLEAEGRKPLGDLEVVRHETTIGWKQRWTKS